MYARLCEAEFAIVNHDERRNRRTPRSLLFTGVHNPVTITPPVPNSHRGFTPVHRPKPSLNTWRHCLKPQRSHTSLEFVALLALLDSTACSALAMETHSFVLC